MFLTETRVLKKISQDREKGNIARARDRALDALEKWPENRDLLMEAIQACFDLSDTHRAVSLLKTALKRHPGDRSTVLNMAREQATYSFNPILASFIIDIYIRDRNLEGIRQTINMAGGNFTADLIKRCQTKWKSFCKTNNTSGKSFVDNALLLGLLYQENEQYEQAVSPLGASLEQSPSDSELIGSILVPVERNLSENSAAKYYLGCVSSNLKHPQKAEERFFQCLQLDDPPLEKLLLTLQSMDQKSNHHQLLLGETLIRMGAMEEGITRIKEYLSPPQGEQARTKQDGPIDQLFSCREDREKLAYNRLSLLLVRAGGNFEMVKLFGELGLRQDNIKEVVEAIRDFFSRNPSQSGRIIEWLEKDQKITMTAPAQQLLTELYLQEGNYKKCSGAATMAAEIEPARIPSIIAFIQENTENTGRDPSLKIALAELQARAGNNESAGEILDSLDSNSEIDSEELFRLTSEVIKHCGVNLDGVLSSIEVSFRGGNASKPVPHVIEYLRENDQSSRTLVDGIYDIGKKKDEYWPLIAEMTEEISGEEKLPRYFRELLARAHLNMGEVEKAVFEFDQLLMFEDNIRMDLIDIYNEAAEKYNHNPTLHLALYQLYQEEDQLTPAAHHLSRVLELDPGQIRDILERFDKLVERDPENIDIWEELLESAVALSHFDLARETLKRAISVLPPESSAGLHVYGARISMGSGKTGEALRCLSLALRSNRPKLKLIQSELLNIADTEPSNAEAHYLLGETMFALGKEEITIEHFRNCLDLSSAYKDKIKNRLEQLLPRSAKPWLLSAILGKIAWQESRFQEAYRRFKETQNGPEQSLQELSDVLKDLRKQHPGDNNLNILYARNLALENRYTESVDILEEMFKSHPDTTDSVLEIIYLLLEREPGQMDANRLLASVMIQKGEPEKSLKPLLRILEHTGSDPSLVDETVTPYLEFHRTDSRFLIPYAVLKDTLDQQEESLSCYREAFRLDRDNWEEILEHIKDRKWDKERAVEGLLLRADCMIEGGWLKEAFRQISSFNTSDPPVINKIMERLRIISSNHPALEHFSAGCALLCRGGMIEQARSLVSEGCGNLDQDDCLKLRIELADHLLSRRHREEANRIYSEILNSPGNRTETLKKIESSHLGWVDRELSLVDGDNIGGIDEQELDRLISIALEDGRAETAMKLFLQSGQKDKARKLKLARIYMDMERPLLVLAVSDSISISAQPDGTELELLYIEGLASEMTCNYHRAYSAFTRIISMKPDYRDCRNRAVKNYTRVIRSQIEEQSHLIEKTTNLHPKG